MYHSDIQKPSKKSLSFLDKLEGKDENNFLVKIKANGRLNQSHFLQKNFFLGRLI